MTEQTELDRTRRYLVPVARLDLPHHPDYVHLSVLEWLEGFQAWATGPALCGYSTTQGALKEGTEVTCSDCLEYRPRYERYLAPGYRPGDDDPEVLRKRAEMAQATIDRTRAFVQDMRTWCSPHGVATDYADRILKVMGQKPEAGQALDTAENGAWHSVWLHGNWRYLTSQMSTPQREHAARCVEAYSKHLAEVDGDPDRDGPWDLRWWLGSSR